MLFIHIYGKNMQNKITVDRKLRNTVKKSCITALYEEGYTGSYEFSVTFTDNEEIRRINKYYRGIDKETDVLSFPMFERDEEFTENPETGSFMLGDIVISLEKARAQALEYGHSFKREIAFLTVHSVLHLLGYDHETSDEDEREMFGKQELILAAMGIDR